jgi:hypothetical protein
MRRIASPGVLVMLGPAGRVRTTMAVALSVLAVPMLAGCHGSSSSANTYCNDVRQSKQAMTALNGTIPNATQFSAVLAAVEQLSAEAPASVQGPWDVLHHTLTNFQATLDHFHLTVDDVAKIEAGTEAIGDPAEYSTLTTAIKGLQSPALSAATAVINAETIKDCQVNLGSG